MPDVTHFATRSEDRISWASRVAYGLGMFVNQLQAAAHGALLVILNLGYGLDPALVGLITFVPRFFDALSDPVLGYVSDRTHSQWGRRRPYIFVGALVGGLIFATMWQLPVGRSAEFYLLTCIVGFSVYFVTYTLYATPLIAMGYELTPDYHERTRLQAFGNSIGQMVWVIAPWFYAFMASDLFQTTTQGARTLATGVGVIMCLVGLLPAVVCREKVQAAVSRSEQFTLEFAGLGRHVVSFFSEFSTAFRCKPFLKLCGATFLVFNGFELGASFSLYVLIYYVYQGDNQSAGQLMGVFGTFSAIFCALAVIPGAAWLATKIGKRETFILANLIAIFGYCLKWIGYNPEHPYLLLVAAPFVACGIGSLFTLMGAMVADVCDYDELERRQRREALFGAIFWWMVKVGMALAGLLAGILLRASGFNVHLETAQSDHTLLLLRVFDVCIPSLASLAAIAIVATYPITEQVAHDIREQLDQRRSALGAGSDE